MSWVITGSQKVPPTVWDPNFLNVSLLLHGNGTNGSTTITDSSPSPKTVTAVGNTQISTAIADPFGNSTGVLAFDGSGDYLGLGTNNSAYALGNGDFTVEAWVYRLNLGLGLIAGGQTNLATFAGSSWQLYVGSSSNSAVYIGSSELSATSPNPAQNQWAHVAMSRSGGTLRTFLNGVIVGTNSSLGTGSVNGGSTVFQAAIGGFSNGASAQLNGYIDDLRITKGVARYTANFTPPTAPFPDI